jgi:gas vesicle structural protein
MTPVFYREDVDFLEPEGDEATLLGVLDTLLDKGIVLSGDIKISVAGVDLLYVGLKLLACSTETAMRYRAANLLGDAA